MSISGFLFRIVIKIMIGHSKQDKRTLLIGVDNMRKNYPIDITRLPFSCRRSRCMVFCENNGASLDVENGLYLSQSTEGMLGGGAQFYRDKNYLLLTPEADGCSITYTYEATTSFVSLKTEKGSILITFAADGGMRIFSDGPGLLVTAKMGFGDVAQKVGEAAEISMDGAMYHMIPTVGSVSVDSHYDLLTYRYTDPVIRFLPENGKLEIAVFDDSFTQMDCIKAGYSEQEAVMQMEAAFAEFQNKLVDAAAVGIEERYSLWIGAKAFPGLKGEVYPSNVVTAVYPRAEEQPVLSMAFSDGNEAYDLLTKFAPLLTKGGLLPEQVSGNKKLYQTVSMLHGLAALELLRKSEISDEQERELYDMLATVDAWWVKNRSTDNGISFYYAYRFESGYPLDGVFSKGTPVVAPDLIARMVLQAEALSQLANRLGFEEATDRWENIADVRLAYLVKELWKGGRFIAWANGEDTAGDSVLCCVPVILGKRLPEEIRTALAAKLTGDLLIPNLGILSGNGRTDTILTCILAAGLYDCGQREAGDALMDAVAKAEESFGLEASYPVDGNVVYRCAGQYTPATCAAVLYAASKRDKEA